MDEVKTVVTERSGVQNEAVAASEAGAVTVVVMPAWQIVAVRALRVYIQSLIGFLTAGATGLAGAVGVNMPIGDFGHLFLACASLAVAPAIMSVLQNTAELLTRLDATNPALRA